MEEQNPTCPVCGGANVRKYVYGRLRARSEEEEKKFNETSIEGGCFLDSTNPLYRCLDCKKNFGTVGDSRKE